MTKTPTLQAKFGDLRTAMRSELLERDQVIEAMILALVAKTHTFLLGPPGVAKSMAIRSITGHIDGLSPEDYFEILMMRSTTREEVFGPLDLPKLKEGRYVFQTRGYLPNAKVVFLDEAWKANSAILNSLLMATNERLFRNDGAVWDIPLWSAFLASNEMPEGEELNAIYDRITFRLLVRGVQEPRNFIEMLKLNAVQQARQTPQAKVKCLAWDDVVTAHNEAMQIGVPNDVLEALNEIRNDLAAASIFPTDRRFVNSVKVIQAAAWLDGETECDIEHIRPLRHIMWDEVDHQPVVEKMLLELANPLDKEAMRLLDDIHKIASDLEKTLRDKDMDDDLRTRRGVELHNKVDDAREELGKLVKQMGQSKRRSAKIQDCKDSLLSVTRRLLTQLFDVDEDMAEDMGI